MAAASSELGGLGVSQFNDLQCVICNEGEDTGEKLTKLRSDGKHTLKTFSTLHGNNDLTGYLLTDPIVVAVHKSCQLSYTKKNRVQKNESEMEQVSVKRLRSADRDKFDYKLNCFLCCQPVSDRFREVMTSEINKKMLEVCENRNDAWGFEVLGRLNTCGDLCAAEARYHIHCHLYFTSSRDKPSSSPATARVGRPVGSEMMKLFDDVCDWMEDSDSELITVEQLHNKMTELSVVPANVYTIGYLKSLLLKKYGDHIWFASVCGRKDVICFRDMASRIVNDQWYKDREAMSVII